MPARRPAAAGVLLRRLGSLGGGGSGRAAPPPSAASMPTTPPHRALASSAGSGSSSSSSSVSGGRTAADAARGSAASSSAGGAEAAAGADKLTAAWRMVMAADAPSGAGGSGSGSGTDGNGAGGLQAAAGRGARALNLLTGYDTVEHLKHEVAAADARLGRLRAQLGEAKSAYDGALESQRSLSKEMALLLSRKSSWGPPDLARFTDVYQAEHESEGGVAAAKASYESAGVAVEAAQAALMVAIRERYTAEQLWSDKIRRAATWWTWGLMGLQAASFVGVYAVMEPRRRELLQAAVGELVEQQGAALGGQLEQLHSTVAALAGGGSGGSSGGTIASSGKAAPAPLQAQKPQHAHASLEAVAGDLRAAAERLEAAVAAAAASSGAVAAPAPAQDAAGRQQRQKQAAAGAAAPPPRRREPRNAAERLAWRAAESAQRVWRRCAAVVLARCPEEVTLSREQAAGLAAASAAAGGALAWLLVAALSAAGSSGGGGGGGGAASSAGAGG